MHAPRVAMQQCAFLLLISVLVAGCARGDAPASDVVRADSAGVRLITSSAVDRDLPWQFKEIDVFRDSAGEPWIFEGLTTNRVVTDRAGRTYVLTSEPSIARFARNGIYDRAFGRKGSAPGEMQFPMSLVVQGDSLAVFDPVRRVLVRFGAILEPIADIPLRDGLANVNEVRFRSGGLWVQRRTFTDDAITLALFADTTSIAPMLSIELPPSAPVRGCNDQLAVALPPFFSPEITWTTSSGRLLANVGPGYELQLYEGPRLIASVRRDLPERAATEADLRRLFPEGMKINFGSIQNCVFEVSDLLTSPGLAASMPYVHGLALLSDATMWVQRSVRNASPSVLDVFGPDGAYAGTIRGMNLPLALLPNGEVLFARADEDSGGQLIVRMRVVH